jgi:TonB family protein
MHTLPWATAESFLLTYAFNALWQVPLIFAATWLAARASRRAAPAFHHTLWTTALFAELLLPALSATPAELLQSAQTWLASFRHTTPAFNPTVIITMGTPHAAATSFQLPPAFLTTAAILYLAALAFFAIRLAIGLHQTASLRRRANPLTLTGQARDSVHRYAKLFAVPHARVATSNEIASPITLGIRRPTLLLPAHLNTLLEEDLDAALAHEFAHIHRRDFAKNLAYELLPLPIAFHPAAWLTRRHMSETREQLCDAMAANAVAGPQRYARSLLRLATQFAAHPNATQTPHAIGIFDAHPFKNFERRVMNLTHRTIELRGAARLVPAALSLTLIAGACTTALAFRQQVAAPQSPTTTVPSTIKLEFAPTDVVPSTIKLDPAPAGVGPSAVVVVAPRPTSGQPAPSIKVDFADASDVQPVVKVLHNVVIEPDQASGGQEARVAAGVIAGNRLTFTAPVYPEDAKNAKLNGTVVLRAIIDKDGSIKTLDVLSSTNPMFNDSALNAVHKWTYKPYLLNGEPTAVDTTITVNYALNK